MIPSKSAIFTLTFRHFILLAFAPHSALSMAQLPIENTVLAEPRVDCGVESISVWIRTEKPFKGRLYVDDEAEHPECVRNYASGGEIGGTLDPRGAEFVIHFGQCHMRRQRQLNPRGVSYSFTMVISFHPVFLTGVDRAFNIKCFFLEAVKAIDASLEVSPLSTSVVERQFTLPQCKYHLKQGIDGPFLKYANIGEPITHVWNCDPVAGWIYGVLIHSCSVDDGHGNRFELVDERGCVVDRYLLADIVYDEKAFSAFAQTHVFRYADRVQLFFTCTIQLCFKEDGGCNGITPPKCDSASTDVHEEKPRESHADSSERHHHRESESHENHGPPHPNRVTPPPGLTRTFFRKFTMPQFPHGPPSELDQRIHPRRPPFHETPFKDSPLVSNGNSNRSETMAMVQVLLDALEGRINETIAKEEGPPHLEETNEQNRSRTGRDTNETNKKMETDLTVELTVLPMQGQAGQPAGNGQDKFEQIRPIKTIEDGGKNKVGFIEILAITGLLLVTAIVTAAITMVWINRCTKRRHPTVARLMQFNQRL